MRLARNPEQVTSLLCPRRGPGRGQRGARGRTRTDWGDALPGQRGGPLPEGDGMGASVCYSSVHNPGHRPQLSSQAHLFPTGNTRARRERS